MVARTLVPLRHFINVDVAWTLALSLVVALLVIVLAWIVLRTPPR